MKAQLSARQPPLTSIRVHIERLVLDGLPVTGSDGALVQEAVEMELARLLSERGLKGISSGAVSHWVGGSIQLDRAGKPHQLGSQVAAALHARLMPLHGLRASPSKVGGSAA